MASYWRSPYNKPNLKSNKQDDSLSVHSGNLDYNRMANIEHLARLHWLDFGTSYTTHRTTSSAIPRQNSSQIKGILKSPSEQDVNDFERMSLYSSSNLSSLKSSARSKKDKKKKVTFETSLADGESDSAAANHQKEPSDSSLYQTKLKLSQTLDESAKYSLKKLLGHYSATNWPGVQGKLTLLKSQTQGPSYTNGQCKHSAHLMCSCCFKKSPDDKSNKVMIDELPKTQVSNTAGNEFEQGEMLKTDDNSILNLQGQHATSRLENVDLLVKNPEQSCNQLSVVDSRVKNTEQSCKHLNDVDSRVKNTEQSCTHLKYVDSRVKNTEQSSHHTQKIYRPWSKTLTYLPHRSSSFTFRNDRSGSMERSNQQVFDSQHLQQNFEVISKLTVTPDGKIRPVKADSAENIRLLNKNTINPRLERYLFHNFKFHHKTPATEVTDDGLQKDLKFPKLNVTDQWTFPRSIENKDSFMSATNLKNTSETNT